MRAILQRVSDASVTVENETVGAVGQGFLVFLGVSKEDGGAEADLLASKIAALRVFEDEEGKLNRSLLDVDGSVLAVSNFTLYADCRRGRRPDFLQAAGRERALPLYERFCARLGELGVHRVERGRFGADMRVRLTNDGPVTIILDTAELKRTKDNIKRKDGNP